MLLYILALSFYASNVETSQCVTKFLFNDNQLSPLNRLSFSNVSPLESLPKELLSLIIKFCRFYFFWSYKCTLMLPDFPNEIKVEALNVDRAGDIHLLTQEPELVYHFVNRKKLGYFSWREVLRQKYQSPVQRRRSIRYTWDLNAWVIDDCFVGSKVQVTDADILANSDGKVTILSEDKRVIYHRPFHYRKVFVDGSELKLTHMCRYQMTDDRMTLVDKTGRVGVLFQVKSRDHEKCALLVTPVACFEATKELYMTLYMGIMCHDPDIENVSSQMRRHVSLLGIAKVHESCVDLIIMQDTRSLAQAQILTKNTIVVQELSFLSAQILILVTEHSIYKLHVDGGFLGMPVGTSQKMISAASVVPAHKDNPATLVLLFNTGQLDIFVHRQQYTTVQKGKEESKRNQWMERCLVQ